MDLIHYVVIILGFIAIINLQRVRILLETLNKIEKIEESRATSKQKTLLFLTEQFNVWESVQSKIFISMDERDAILKKIQDIELRLRSTTLDCGDLAHLLTNSCWITEVVRLKTVYKAITEQKDAKLFISGLETNGVPVDLYKNTIDRVNKLSEPEGNSI